MFYFIKLVVREKRDVAKNHAWLVACGEPALGHVGPDVANVRNFRTSNNVVVMNIKSGVRFVRHHVLKKVSAKSKGTKAQN